MKRLLQSKRPLCVLLTLAAAFCLQWNARAATTVASDTTAWSGGEYEVTGNVTIDSRIEVSGNVTLTLASGTLTAPKGINVTGSARLTINGTSGALLVNGAERDAA